VRAAYFSTFESAFETVHPNIDFSYAQSTL